MTRKIIKKLINTPEEFICESQQDLDRNAKKLEDRPIIFTGRRTNRDEQWVLQDFIALKNPKDSKKGVTGMGEAFKYMWEHIVTEVRNVFEVGDCITGADKNALWESTMSPEIDECIMHFYLGSRLDENEVKT